MYTSIRPFKIEDGEIISQLFPEDWNFDFIPFIEKHGKEKYFKAISFMLDDQVTGYGNIIFFSRIGWLGNIVIVEEYRNKGFGTEVTVELLKIGKELGVTTYNLIATELGEFVYKKLGFERALLYEFYEPPEKILHIETSNDIRNVKESDLNIIAHLDFLSTGEDRRELLQNFLQNAKLIFNPTNRLTGFYLKNLGNGLIVSRDKNSGIELMKLMINEGKKIVITDRNAPAREFLLSNGYTYKKSAPRMVLGKKYPWKPGNIFNRSSGYLG